MGEEREGAGGATAYQVGAFHELITNTEIENVVWDAMDDIRPEILIAQGD